MRMNHKNLFLGVFLALSAAFTGTGAMAQADAPAPAAVCNTVDMTKDWLASQGIPLYAIDSFKPLAPDDYAKLVAFYENLGQPVPATTVSIDVTVVPAGMFIAAFDANGCETGAVVVDINAYAAIFGE